MNPNYLDFLYNLGVFNIKLGLSTIDKMLKHLGNPHHHPRIIHIAGTNGKGSTLTTIEKLLLDSGYTTGATISPHLISFNERFRLDGKPAEDDELNQVFETVCKACGIDLALTKPGSLDGDIQPTFFEFSIAMAFELFRRSRVDFILLETGLGGRLDATNIVTNPLACVLTRISIDHQDYLGETIEEITAEKLGIVKKGSPVFVSWQEKNVYEQIKGFCNENEAQYCPQDFGYKSDEELNATYYYLKPFKNYGDSKEPTQVKLNIKEQSLSGEHQKQNTALALAVYFAVVPSHRHLRPDEVEKSLQKIQWKGRLEYMDAQKSILLDGAHNVSAIQSLLTYLAEHHRNKKVLFAINWKQDKRFIEIFQEFETSRMEFIPIEITSVKTAKAETISRLLQKYRFITHPYMDVKQLTSGIKQKTLPEYDLLVVTGSLYLIGEFLAEWKQMNN